MIAAEPYVALSLILFCLGLIGLMVRRNFITVLMSVELMFNAVNINFVAFSRYITPADFTGQVFAVFTIVIAAAEATVGLAIVLLIYRSFRDIYVDDINIMKW